MDNILLITEDKKQYIPLSLKLNEDGCETHIKIPSIDLLADLESHNYDLIVVDTLAASIKVSNILKKIRTSPYNTLVFILDSDLESNSELKIKDENTIIFTPKPYKVLDLCPYIKLALKNHELNVLNKYLVEETKKSSRQVRVLVEMLPVGVFQTDEHGNFEWVNEEYKNITGLSLKDVVAQKWKKILHEDDRKQTLVSWRKFIKSGGKLRISYKLKRADGKIKYVSSLVSKIKNNGFIGVVIDFTEQTEKSIIAMTRIMNKVDMFSSKAENIGEIIDNVQSGITGLK